MIQNEVLDDFLKMSKMIEEKDQRIKELEKENKNKSQLGLALYTALVKELEKQGLTDDIPSVIDQLVGKNCGKYADMYNEYKNQKKELSLYKKALELACESILNGDTKDFDYCLRKEEIEMHFINTAKEKINANK